MNNRISRGLGAVVAALAVILGALIAIPASATASSIVFTPAQAIAQLNTWRASVGLLPVVEDATQTAGCKAHVNYMILNNVFTHAETPGLPGYTGGAAAANASEVLSSGAVGPRAWEWAPFHRAMLLDPRLAAIGYWDEGGYACMRSSFDDTGTTRTTPAVTAYPYPANGQTGVPTTFGCNESPNPCTTVPGNNGSTPTGTILSVYLNGPLEGYFGPSYLTESTTVTLIPDGGKAAPVTFDGENIIPNTPLAPATWYTVAVNGTLNLSSAYAWNDTTGQEEPAGPFQPFSFSWRFRTATDATSDTQTQGSKTGVHKLAAVKNLKAKRRGKKLTLTWKPVPGAASYQVRITRGPKTINAISTRHHRLVRKVGRKRVKATVWALNKQGQLGKPRSIRK